MKMIAAATMPDDDQTEQISSQQHRCHRSRLAAMAFVTGCLLFIASLIIEPSTSSFVAAHAHNAIRRTPSTLRRSMLHNGANDERSEDSSINEMDLSSNDGRPLKKPQEDQVCNMGVLITTQEGIEIPSSFAHTLTDIGTKKQHQERSFYTNHIAGNADGFSHVPATYWKQHNATSISGPIHRYISEYGIYRTVCFGRVLVIVDDDDFLQTRLSEDQQDDQQEATKDIISSSNDDDDDYVSGWYHASQDRSNWPEIKIVTEQTLYDNIIDNARWIIGGDDDEEDLKALSDFISSSSDTKKTTHQVVHEHNIMAAKDDEDDVVTTLLKST